MKRDPMEMALSIDIVMDNVLSHLKVGDLLNCRKVSKFWNNVSATVLRRRSTMIKNISKEEDLMELEECMKRSSDFSFSGLILNEPWSLNSSDATRFFQNYGATFTRLCLDTTLVHRLHDLAPFISHLTRLSILEVGKAGSIPWIVELPNSATGRKDGRFLKLPSLQTIRIAGFPAIDQGVFGEVLAAASPSLRIECLETTSDILRILKNTGKLRSVTSFRFDLDEGCANCELKGDPFLSPADSPALTKLDFNIVGCLSVGGLMNILLSSQNTLRQLHLDGIFAWENFWVQMPVLRKLTTLSLCVNFDYSCKHLFRRGHGPKFPALKELKIKISYDGITNVGVALSDGLFIVPSVTRIDLRGYVSEEGMKELAQTFPNVSEMGLQYDYYSGDAESDGICGGNAFEIWSVREFKYLEKLRIWDFVVRRPTKNYINMDSFLTGIPVGICKNMQKKKQLMIHFSNCPFREAFIQVIRENPNILQVKNLKELLVCLKPGDELKELPGDAPFISMISVWYALEMMPQLEVKFVYDAPSPPWREEDRGNSFLEAAFKHVKPFAKLERLFY